MLLGITVVSCEDDFNYGGDYGDGTAAISTELLVYEVPVKVSRAVADDNPVTGGTPGNVIGRITDSSKLSVLVYNAVDGSLYRVFSGDDLENYKYDEKGNTDSPADAVVDGEQAETATGRATFSIGAREQSNRIPYGRYRIYAVANLDLSTDEYAKESDLKNKLLSWNPDIAKNNQMFGYFTEAENATMRPSAGFDAPALELKRPNVSIHSWIKRAVSKLTIAFDGTNLKPGVEIFIKSVEIRDIPNTCLLGADNTPVSNDDLIDKSQYMYYGSGDNYTGQWIGYVSKTHPINGYDQSIVANGSLSKEQKIELLHSEDTPAFYFFENMQGLGEEGTASDKRQQVKDEHRDLGVVSFPDGSDPSDHAWKDTKKYGTYVVVHAHYKSDKAGEGEGEIIYRFMLGKDTRLDYNAQRNYHYKLTLRFNGYANDVDWHIDYRRDPDKVRVQVPFYISYLYGQHGRLPIEFDESDPETKITEIKAEIISNDWAPTGVDVAGTTTAEQYGCDYAYDAGIKYDAAAKVYNVKTEFAKYYDKYYLYLRSQRDPVTYKSSGFLSLRKPSNLIEVLNPDGVNGTNYPIKRNSNDTHWNSGELGKRTYTASELELTDPDITPMEAMAKDIPHVAWEDGTYYVKLPIWTRARMLIKETGYTGNNPYTAYFREAKIKLTVTLTDKDGNTRVINSFVSPNGEPQKELTVHQVRRIVNPKGVYRDNGNSSNFHVVLKYLESENDTKFKNLKSEGPWRAYVIRDTEANNTDGSGGFVSLSSTDNGAMAGETKYWYLNETETRPTVENVGNSPIDFYINFKDGNNGGKPRYAVIRVEYNGYSCYHLIFVRQGYDADDTFGDGNKWMVFNQISKTEYATDPRDEGSMFKFSNWSGIPSSYNKNNKANWVNITPNDFNANALGTTSITLSQPQGNYKTRQYSEITSYNLNVKDPTGFFDDPSDMRVASADDYKTLAPPKQAGGDHDFTVKTGVGVLYADGANATLDSRANAYGYKADGDQSYGMRGVFAYDIRTGKNLFFPIGSSGYGHRKNSIKSGSSDTTLRGLLRYNCNSRWGYFDAVAANSYADGVWSAPLFFDVFRSEGAIYWYKETGGLRESYVASGKTQYSHYAAWDMNYTTLDFGAIGSGDVEHGADACFVRCIEK